MTDLQCKCDQLKSELKTKAPRREKPDTAMKNRVPGNTGLKKLKGG